MGSCFMIFQTLYPKQCCVICPNVIKKGLVGYRPINYHLMCETANLPYIAELGHRILYKAVVNIYSGNGY